MPPPDPLGSLSIALFGLTVAPGSKAVRRTCALALIIFQAYVIFRPYPPTIPRFFIYQNALSSSLNILVYFDHAIINDTDLNQKRKGQTLPFTQMPFLQRLKWSADLMFTNRGVNWTWEVPYLRRSTRSRWSFVRYQFFRVLVCVLASDVLRFLRAENPAWQINTDEGFGSRGFAWRIYNVMIFWLSTASLQIHNYSLLAMITVAVGVCEPRDWPSFYGPLDSAKSIRLFWGRTWHQLLRRPLQAHGRFISTNILGLNPKGNFSSYTQLYIAFFLSGICHAIADLAVSKVFQDGWSTLIYYMLQAVIITFEDGLIALGRTVGIRQVPSLVNYVWVIFWVGLLTPIWVESIAKRGIVLEPPISFLSPSQIHALI